MILCGNPKEQYSAHKKEIKEAVNSVLESGWYIHGTKHNAFEKAFAEYTGTEHAVGVANGTDALHLSLRAFGIGKGDEVITVSHTAVATVSAVRMAGATPVMVDVEKDYYTLDPACLEKALSKKTKAVIAVHLYGQLADIDAILAFTKKHNLKLIEDCAQCTGGMYKGRKAGSFGDVGTFSFYPTKNLGAIGDGGMIVCNNTELAEKLRLLRQYGWKEKSNSLLKGWNSRLDEIQAAILMAKLPFLDEDNNKRITAAYFYDRELADLPLTLPERRKDTKHVFHLYVLRCEKRDELRTFLREKGIGAEIHYVLGAHQQDAFKEEKTYPENLPVTEKYVKEILSLPMYPELKEEELRYITDSVKEFYK